MIEGIIGFVLGCIVMTTAMMGYAVCVRGSRCGDEYDNVVTQREERDE